MKYLILLFSILFHSFTFAQETQKEHTLPKGFVYVKDYMPNVEVDLRYLSNNNFVGQPINGYIEPKLILTKKATLALVKVEEELNQKGLGLILFDGYRPQTAVNHFKKWAKDLKDTKMKSEFYPRVDKSILFKEGYIASKSGHSRGSTIDLNIIDLKTKKEWDMGTEFDFFGPESGHDYKKLKNNQIENRKFLKNLMEKHGFRAYSKEWWHYTLINEPFTKTYYDFKVK